MFGPRERHSWAEAPATPNTRRRARPRVSAFQTFDADRWISGLREQLRSALVHRPVSDVAYATPERPTPRGGRPSAAFTPNISARRALALDDDSFDVDESRAPLNDTPSKEVPVDKLADVESKEDHVEEEEEEEEVDVGDGEDDEPAHEDPAAAYMKRTAGALREMLGHGGVVDAESGEPMDMDDFAERVVHVDRAAPPREDEDGLNALSLIASLRAEGAQEPSLDIERLLEMRAARAQGLSEREQPEPGAPKLRPLIEEIGGDDNEAEDEEDDDGEDEEAEDEEEEDEGEAEDEDEDGQEEHDQIAPSQAMEEEHEELPREAPESISALRAAPTAADLPAQENEAAEAEELEREQEEDDQVEEQESLALERAQDPEEEEDHEADEEYEPVDPKFGVPIPESHKRSLLAEDAQAPDGDQGPDQAQLEKDIEAGEEEVEHVQEQPDQPEDQAPETQPHILSHLDEHTEPPEQPSRLLPEHERPDLDSEEGTEKLEDDEDDADDAEDQVELPTEEFATEQAKDAQAEVPTSSVRPMRRLSESKQLGKESHPVVILSDTDEEGDEGGKDEVKGADEPAPSRTAPEELAAFAGESAEQMPYSAPDSMPFVEVPSRALHEPLLQELLNDATGSSQEQAPEHEPEQPAEPPAQSQAPVEHDVHVALPPSLHEREPPGESYSLAEWVTGLEPDGEDASPEDEQTTEPQKGTEQPTAEDQEAEPVPPVQEAEPEAAAENGPPEKEAEPEKAPEHGPPEKEAEPEKAPEHGPPEEEAEPGMAAEHDRPVQEAGPETAAEPGLPVQEAEPETAAEHGPPEEETEPETAPEHDRPEDEADRSTDLLEQALDPSLERRRAPRHSLRSHCALQRLSLMQFDGAPTFLVRECVLDPDVLQEEGAEAQPVLTDSLEMEPLDAGALPEHIYHSLCHIVGPSMLEQVFVVPGSTGEQWMQGEQAAEEQDAEAKAAQASGTSEPAGTGQDEGVHEDVVEAATAKGESQVAGEAAAAGEVQGADRSPGEPPQASASDAEDEAEVEASADLREEHKAATAPQEAAPFTQEAGLAPREAESASPPPVHRHDAPSTYESRTRRRRQQPRRSSARLQQKQPPAPEPPAPKSARSRKRKAEAEEPAELAPTRLRSRRERKPRRPFSPGP